MKQYPKISIITPSYMQGHLIEETIISVIGQGYPNLEYIVMDGDSTDRTVDILEKYNNQITFWKSEKDKGQSDAINSGFERATGDILMWLNSDDLLLPNSLFYIAQKVEQNGDGLYFGNSIHFKEDGSLWAEGSDVVARHKKENIKNIDYLIQPSSWWTRKVWEDTGKLNENIHFVFDWEWFMRVNDKFQFYPQNKVISLYRFHDEHKSGSGGNKRQLEILSLLKKHSPREAKLYEMLMSDDAKLNINSINRMCLLPHKLLCRLKGEYFTDAMALKILKRAKFKDYSLEEIYKYQSL